MGREFTHKKLAKEIFLPSGYRAFSKETAANENTQTTYSKKKLNSIFLQLFYLQLCGGVHMTTRVACYMALCENDDEQEGKEGKHARYTRKIW